MSDQYFQLEALLGLLEEKGILSKQEFQGKINQIVTNFYLKEFDEFRNCLEGFEKNRFVNEGLDFLGDAFDIYSNVKKIGRQPFDNISRVYFNKLQTTIDSLFNSSAAESDQYLNESFIKILHQQLGYIGGFKSLPDGILVSFNRLILLLSLRHIGMTHPSFRSIFGNSSPKAFGEIRGRVLSFNNDELNEMVEDFIEFMT